MPSKTSNSVRDVIIPDYIFELLDKYLEVLPSVENDKRLFPTIRSSLNKRLTTACKHTGVKRIRVHDLRHSQASFLINKGFSPLMVQEILDDKDIETTLNTYSHLYPDKQSEVAESLQKLLRPI